MDDDCKNCCSSKSERTKMNTNSPVYVLFHAKGEQRIENYRIDPIRIFLNYKDARKVYERMVQEHKRNTNTSSNPLSSVATAAQDKKQNMFPTRIYLAQWGNMNGKLRDGNGFIQEKTLHEWKENTRPDASLDSDISSQ